MTAALRDDGAGAAGRRVAMLVGNGVRGDSRVQKVARSMADRGWEIVLFGRSATGRTERFVIGRASVLLLPVPRVVSGYDRARVRRPLPDPAVRAAYREARALLARWDAWDSGGRGDALRAASRGWLARHPAADALAAVLGSGPLAGPLRHAGTAVAGLVGRGGGWRALNPWLRDLELAFSPAVSAFRPDLIHAHDFHMVGIGARLARRLSTPARTVRWVYDAHEYLAGVEVPRRGDPRGRLRRRMLLGVEAEHIRRADAVVTVSEAIAERLRRDHALPVLPRVVLNAPWRPPAAANAAGEARPSVRAVVGLPDEVPLLLYSGGLAPRRGLATVVRGLAALPGVHLALVARDDDPDLAGLLDLAEHEGVRGRIHPAPYVAPERVVDYFESATIGLVPILHRPNHELSLITKYFEYLHAHLPVVTSDVRHMAETTRRLGVGEVFRAGDPEDFAAAVRRVLTHLERYRRRYSDRVTDPAARYRWEPQADALHALYRRLLCAAEPAAAG
ncbi:glycosyltransferase family 4 protein [Allostreptomyces psammosilenae]|uniref:D-inositol 3-phosphate glycosyltransferase n=1 Tax=Allostreptomyces psammosilenae TaxID=1892865 RepID=A0A853A1G6_9ACTN|nr:glycosyltransferase family 4 protein [Allostreptomyces psammosilenae]NYI08473.1 glycosyltransferase involved in cell wall biosynthesis [Allostreptomyces psammosilenae]